MTKQLYFYCQEEKADGDVPDAAPAMKTLESAVFHEMWTCALCQRVNVPDVNECVDCFQPRLVGDFKSRLEKIEPKHIVKQTAIEDPVAYGKRILKLMYSNNSNSYVLIYVF